MRLLLAEDEKALSKALAAGSFRRKTATGEQQRRWESCGMRTVTEDTV